MRPGVDIGIVRDLQERRERLAAAHATLVKRTISRVYSQPIYEKGRYISPTLRRLIALVARHSDLSTESIRGAGRVHRLINARYCIANLADEFASRLSARSVDDGMLRGEGSCLYYRMRHRDRIELFPEYGDLHERCRAELLRRVSP